MRVVSLGFIFMFSINVFAGQWYIVDKYDKGVVATSSVMPDENDLDSRNQITVYSEDMIPLDKADYKNKSIVLHEKTSKELSDEKELKEKEEKEAKIQAKMRELAEKALAEEGY